MKKILMLGMVLTVSVAMMMTSCKKDNNNGNDNGNTENPRKDGSVTPNQEYPSTAVVLPQAVTDIDGNTYDAVQIGDQVWMAQNLRTTHFADGTAIPAGGSNYSSSHPYYYDYSSSGIALSSRGYLYNWPAAMHSAASSSANPSGVQGICPNGWHLPSDAEWTQLTDYVSSQSQYVCGGDSTYIAKALASTTGWNTDSEACAVGNDPTDNNVTGFSAVPAGLCAGPSFDYAGTIACFCSSTQTHSYSAFYRYLRYNSAYVDNYYYYYSKFNGFSVRCLRD